MSRPVDVLHVIESLAQGGAEQNLLSLLRALDRSRFRNHLAWLSRADARRDLSEAYRPHVASMIPLDVERMQELGRGVRTLARWMRTQRPALVHTQILRAQLVGRLARALTLGPPIVSTWVAPIYEGHALADFGGSRRRRALLQLADAVTGIGDARFIAVSEETAESYSRALGIPSRKISVVHPIIDPARYAPVPDSELRAKRRALDVADDATLLLSVARLVPQKAHLAALDALPAVLERHPRVVFVIAGAGPLEAEIRAKVDALGLGHAVRMLGYRSDAPALYQLCDVWYFPSIYEGLPVALLEALANGMPAVLSDIAPHREVGASLSSVWLVPPGDVAGLSRALIEVLDRGASLETDVAKTTEAIRRGYSPATIAAQYEEIFDAAIAGRSPR